MTIVKGLPSGILAAMDHPFISLLSHLNGHSSVRFGSVQEAQWFPEP